MDRTEKKEIGNLSPDQEKAIRLFLYLKDICALRATQIRNVNTFDQVFWVNDLPRHKLCRSAIWRITGVPQTTAEQHGEPWIEIRKPALKSPPELPDDLEPWIKDEELSDSSLSEPGFYERIPLSALQGDPENADPNTLIAIDDYPHVSDKRIRYVEQWKKWAEEDRELQKVQKAYNKLFNIYQRQEKFGEQYEVVIGVGLLSWRSPGSGEIRRHIVALQARIDFDRIRGIIVLSSALDGPQPTLECDMLETSDRPNPTDFTGIEQDVIALDGDPWDAVRLAHVLRGFVNALPVNGDYVELFDHAGPTTEKPLLKLAPAVILRKRTRRTFEDFYRQIVDQLKEGGEVPENIRRIVDIVEDRESEGERWLTSGVGTATPKILDDELYFPLPANEEQKRIVQKVEQRRGVLVQGPPGTGKSHSIANLVSHFLAKGKRILVTSETPRALEVLRNKLPREIESLCVVWLGSGPDSQKALEKSVVGITQRKANWDASREQRAIEQLARQLDSERSEQARLRHELRASRESDVYRHADIFGRYSGTLQQIAVQISEERDFHGWFLDRPTGTAGPNVTSDELLKMAEIRRKLNPGLIEQLELKLFPLEKLIPPDDFSRFVEAEKEAERTHKEAHPNRSYVGYSQLLTLDRKKRDAIKGMIEGILATQCALSKHFHSWAERACREITGDQDRVWRQVLAGTISHINSIEQILNEHGSLDVSGLESSELGVVEEHATALKKHLISGKGLGFGFFRARVVKDSLYLVNSVKVNGKLCDNIKTLNQLIAWLTVASKLQALGELWKSITTPPSGNAVIQCSAYRDLCEPIEEALRLHDKIEEIRRACRDCPGIHFPAWHSPQEVRSLDGALEAVRVDEEFTAAQKVFAPLVQLLTESLNSGKSHRSTEEVLHAVSGRDARLYRHTYEKLADLHSWRKSQLLAEDVCERYRSCAPRTCQVYEKSYSDEVWSERFGRFESAWVWAKTDRWLTEVNDKDRPKRSERALENSVHRERDCLKKLAACKAWQHCMNKLREKERMALIAWSQAVAKVRSGTGRYVETYRETAKQKLEECRSAIPAWVMPLYQVVQTTRPKRDQFDIVIIDEASQSGPEALLLNYISEKIIVVGDDKQITPMHVGVDREQVQYLQRKHLRDIPHASSLDLEGSLFAQAELRFPDRIRLREHFRCMPEIIQFSNNLSYTSEPLIPLKQYGADRLPPIRTFLVKEGYRKGSSDDIVNVPEAKALVGQIAECCEDPAYAGKTFGVITLMGTSQAELINSLLLGKDGIGAEEMEKRHLVCGRPYDFQGDERDVIFLSMVDAPQDGHPCRMVRDEDTQRRFNVAVSRARDQLWLFHSVTLNDLRPECLRYRLLEYCQNPRVDQAEVIGETTISALRRMALSKPLREGKPRDADNSLPFDSWFEVDIFLKIVDHGYRVLPQYEIGGYRIDLLVEGLKGRLAVECDGDEWHGSERYESDMARQRDLERCQMVFWRVRGSDYYRDPDTALRELWETLETLKIRPRHSWESDRKLEETAISSNNPNQVIDSAETSTEEELGEDEFESPVRAETEGDRTEQISGSPRRRPEAMPPTDIQNAMLRVLYKCPNRSCTLKSITSRVLKELGVVTRGNPRIEFEKRVMRNLGVLKRKELIEEYKAKNKRIRLLPKSNNVDTLL